MMTDPIREEQQRKASRRADGEGSALGSKAKHPDERADAQTQESGEAPTAGENPALPTTLDPIREAAEALRQILLDGCDDFGLAVIEAALREQRAAGMREAARLALYGVRATFCARIEQRAKEVEGG